MSKIALMDISVSSTNARPHVCRGQQSRLGVDGGKRFGRDPNIDNLQATNVREPWRTNESELWIRKSHG
jgi:hypothetical protein